ncbi:MAG: Ig-like domain-containing protein, partial [Muribaculaceae bacterium]|nr:Ig-like domain-containing protein [Muribaculaceae bacterium]
MKKSLLFLLSLLVTSTMFAGVIRITPNETKAANSATKYVTEAFKVPVDGYDFYFNQVNPSSGQIRVNKTGASAFSLYNSTAIEGLKSVTITANATTLGKWHMKVGETTITGNATTDDIEGYVSDKTVTFTVPEGTEGQFFHLNITTKGSGTVNFTEILVEYADNDLRQESGLAFPQKEYTVNLGEEFESPVATAFEGAEIEYSIDKEEVATIDAQTGKLTIVGAGTATVSAISK